MVTNTQLTWKFMSQFNVMEHNNYHKHNLITDSIDINKPSEDWIYSHG